MGGDLYKPKQSHSHRESVRHDALQKRKWKKRKRPIIVAGGIFVVATLLVSNSFRSADDHTVTIDVQENVETENTSLETDLSTERDILTGVGGGPEKEQENVIRYTITDGDIPAEVFAQQAGYDANDIQALLAAAKDIYDFTSMRIGKELVFYFGAGEALAQEVHYEPTGARKIIAQRSGDDFTVREEEIQYEITQEVAEVTIENSLYVDALGAGISEATVIGVGEVFAFTIDFASEIQKGDTLRVVYEKRTRDGNPAKDGKVLAAVFNASGTDHYAYHFDTDTDDEEFGGYYDEEARVLERQFLKAPLDFFRITSGYTGRRLHPVINKYTAHYQIDYAAPSGTPTFATAGGTVVSAGFERGWGNIVRLKHSGGYTTHYAHLSAYAKGITRGTKVKQGETIGYVGSTGWSTGPHVDYGMKLNGNPVNPLKIQLPKGEPIADDQRDAFFEEKSTYDNLLLKS